jgi:hypothetical protein
MRVFMRSIDYEMWDLTKNGFNQLILELAKWTLIEKKMIELDNKALHILHVSVSRLI